MHTRNVLPYNNDLPGFKGHQWKTLFRFRRLNVQPSLGSM